jgi:hypothetical protein
LVSLEFGNRDVAAAAVVLAGASLEFGNRDVAAASVVLADEEQADGEGHAPGWL